MIRDEGIARVPVALRRKAGCTAFLLAVLGLSYSSPLPAQKRNADSSAALVLIAITDTSYYFADLANTQTLGEENVFLVRIFIDPRPGDYFEDSLSIPRIGRIEEGWRVDCRRGTLSRFDRGLYDRFLKRVAYSVDSPSKGRQYPIGTIAAQLFLTTCRYRLARR
jgi:hypothetical protein